MRCARRTALRLGNLCQVVLRNTTPNGVTTTTMPPVPPQCETTAVFRNAVPVKARRDCHVRFKSGSVPSNFCAASHAAPANRTDDGDGVGHAFCEDKELNMSPPKENLSASRD